MIKQKINFIKRQSKTKLITAIILFAFLILSFFFTDFIETSLKLRESSSIHQVSNEIIESSNFKVTYIDVGQGNTCYIKFPDGKTMIIDGGNVEYSQKVASVLEADGVTKIDYLIASHADSDHIAGLNYILDKYEVKNIYRPFQIAGTGTNLENFEVYEDEDLSEVYYYLNEITDNKSKISRVTTSVYKRFISNIYSEYYCEDDIYYKSTVTVFYDGLKVVGENYSFEFFAPLVMDENINLSEFSNTEGYATIGYGTTNSNDNSAIILVNCEDNTFLFTGDASWTSNIYEGEANSGKEEIDFVNSLTEEERQLFKNVSVYLLGHHGSSYSSGESLLELIDANFFVVSVEENSSYGHPNSDTLARITKYKKFDDYLLMTKDNGNITFGLVDNNLVYCLEKSENTSRLSISWFMLGTILYIFVIFFIFSIRVKPQKKQSY